MTNSRKKHKANFDAALRELEEDLRALQVMGQIPLGWHDLERQRMEPSKTRITLRLDSDMVKWFRKLGPGYQTRINKILRLYYHGLLSGDIAVEED